MVFPSLCCCTMKYERNSSANSFLFCFVGSCYEIYCRRSYFVYKVKFANNLNWIKFDVFFFFIFSLEIFCLMHDWIQLKDYYYCSKMNIDFFLYVRQWYSCSERTVFAQTERRNNTHCENRYYAFSVHDWLFMVCKLRNFSSQLICWNWLGNRRADTSHSKFLLNDFIRRSLCTMKWINKYVHFIDTIVKIDNLFIFQLNFGFIDRQPFFLTFRV